MLRIYKYNEIVLDLEKVSCITHKDTHSQMTVYIEGKPVMIYTDVAKKILKAWEEYIEDKESKMCPIFPLTTSISEDFLEVKKNLNEETNVRSLKHMFIDTKTGKFGFYNECSQDLGERFTTLEECIEKFDEYVDYLNREK